MFSNSYLATHWIYADQVRKTYRMTKIMLIINIRELRLKNTFQTDKYKSFNQSVSTYKLIQKPCLWLWTKVSGHPGRSPQIAYYLSRENFINPILTFFSNTLSGWEVPQRSQHCISPSCPEGTSLERNSKPSGKWAVLIKQILASDRGSHWNFHPSFWGFFNNTDIPQFGHWRLKALFLLCLLFLLLLRTVHYSSCLHI